MNLTKAKNKGQNINPNWSPPNPGIKFAVVGGGSTLLIFLQSLPADSKIRAFITPIIPFIPTYYHDFIVFIKNVIRKHQITKEETGLSQLFETVLQNTNNSPEFETQVRQLKEDHTLKKIKNAQSRIESLEASFLKDSSTHTSIQKAKTDTNKKRSSN
jgi:hypothetical protein